MVTKTVKMDKLWNIPDMWEDCSRARKNELQIMHKVDKSIKYSNNCKHCFEPRHYSEKGLDKPLYLYYSDFPKIGKGKVNKCPRCS